MYLNDKHLFFDLHLYCLLTISYHHSRHGIVCEQPPMTNESQKPVWPLCTSPPLHRLRSVSLSRSPGSKVGSPWSREGSPGSQGGMVASRVVDAFTGRGREGAGWNLLSWSGIAPSRGMSSWPDHVDHYFTQPPKVCQIL